MYHSAKFLTNIITHYWQPFQIFVCLSDTILTNCEWSALELVSSSVTCRSSTWKNRDMRQVFEVLHGDFLYNIKQVSKDISTLSVGFILPLSINCLSCDTVQNHFQSSKSFDIHQTDFIRVQLWAIFSTSHFCKIIINCS